MGMACSYGIILWGEEEEVHGGGGNSIESSFQLHKKLTSGLENNISLRVGLTG
jgi:hypothetical protein